MDLYDVNTLHLKEIWTDEIARQHAKLVITVAIAHATELTAKDTLEVMAELDRLLLDEKAEPATRPDPAT